MIKSPLLEVFNIEPRLKHPTIFDHFDALDSGESFIIKNDHDPKPLYYQLLGERGKDLIWNYLESGPEYWQVRLGKPLESETLETVGHIAAKDIRKAEVLKQLGVDFCCGGKQTLKEAAHSVGLDEIELRRRLNQSEELPIAGPPLNFKDWDIDFLSDYIKNVHHRYVREKGPIIQELAHKVADVHAQQHPELVNLSQELDAFLDDLYHHLDKEEKQLFPATKNEQELTSKQVDQLIQFLISEHEDSGKELQQLRKITQNYTLPANACNSYTSLFSQIESFESDLLQHIHLENNILFPKLLASYGVQMN
ncbi:MULTISPECIES: iron-sulfur cluster repair di-iron protein [Sphingobacterium]|jgi:regulator of cell morphogenesis and NO signaling|uniref:Iron-sulfur cluster repair di-iron protein n=1 Tax=Sphingobacterium multivorum TaxID=28454 RepID=A0A654CPC5_SPHMU|nr:MULTISPECIES: iron-sulfur cluster repair di-iron protein [Sphingobacterium]HAF34444.1 iron-sulfur cluster repair di-iron protein [Sphingobacterium sp.]OFV14853.1 iron-sulfur cluster repair di-iron protein [Sphingobacterium sp. HMSC13C05]OJZ15169.1 MAG: iron-sulfur cluster repair di-iron protein [Sphingobacterium sp. 40-24]QQT44608.1 iron-sulfur cluster repair di-iron protein [Sphingobacterium multivorum]SUJ87862.1 Cell wall-related protein ScdA [Sphingobacterium multivorum]